VQPWLGHWDYLQAGPAWPRVSHTAPKALPALAAGAGSIARNQRALREHAVPFEPLDPSELIWGRRAIGRAIGRTEAATFYALERGRVLDARRIGGRWALHVPSFRASFECMASELTCTPGELDNPRRA
jgi:hypothetical protein